jgi:hypothetical protein
VQRPNWIAAAALTRLAAVGLGFAFGMYFVLTSLYRDAPLWSVWAALAVALTTAAGAVFGYGLDRWAELLTLHPVRVRDVATPVAAIATVTLLLLLTSTRLPGPAQSTWRSVALLTFPILGGVPAAGVMYGVRRAADDESVPDLKGEQVALLVALRQLLQRLLAAIGSLVALSTLATAAVLALQRSVPVGPDRSGTVVPPPQVVLVGGGLGSLLVGLFYVPAATALQRRGRGLCDELFPLAKADQASAILSLAEDRNKLGQLLGIDHGVVADLQTGLAILGPLLASAAATFLPH